MSRITRLLPLALLAASCQTTQHGQTVIPGYDQWGITKSGGELELSATTIKETRESTTGSLTHDETRFREEFLWAVGGFYYHPKLMEFDLTGRFGLEQRDVTASGSLAGNSTDGESVGYNLRTRFLKDLAYGAELFSSREERRRRQRFFDINRSVVTEHGVRLFAREWWIPSRLEVSTYRNEGRGLFDFVEDRDTVRLEGNRSELSADYRYLVESVDVVSGQLSQQFDVIRVSASMQQRFGKANRNRLSSAFRYREQTGFGEYATGSWDNSYRHGWTDSLRSDHGLRISMQERSGRRTDAIAANSGIAHTLFSSLTTGAGLHWLSSDTEGAVFDVFGAYGQATYRKRTPVGRVIFDQRVESRIQDRGSLSGSAVVLDESHLYTAGVPLVLDNIGVDAMSIIVTDAAGLVTYTEGVDYLVAQTSFQTRIEVPPGSLILSGSTILVDYEYQTTPEQKIATAQSSTSLSLSTEGISDLNVRYVTTSQTLRDGFEDGTLDDSQRLFAMGRVYPVEALTVGAEFEDYDSRIGPFTRTAAFAEYLTRPTLRSSWANSARIYRIDFEDAAEPQKGVRLRSSLTSSFSKSARAILAAEYHREEFSTDKGSGYMFDASVRKDFGMTRVEFRALYLSEDFDLAFDQDVLQFQLLFTRTF